MTRLSSARGARGLAALAVLGALALGTTTACASSSTAGTAASGASSGTTTVPTLIPLPTVSGSASGSASPGGTASGIKAAGYTVNGDVLTVEFFAGVCSTYALKADQSASGAVQVTVLATPKGAKGQMCPQLVRLQAVSTNLGSPLDGRSVVDTSTGKTLAQTRTIPGGGRVTHGPVHS